MDRESSPVISGIRMQSPQLPAPGRVPPAWPWLRTFSNPTELNLVKEEGLENNFFCSPGLKPSPLQTFIPTSPELCSLCSVLHPG